MRTDNIQNMREHIKCVICDSDDYRVIFTNSKDKFMKRLGIPGKSRLVMCKNCSLVYHNPRIKEGLMKALYLTYEYPTRSKSVQLARQKDANERFEWLGPVHNDVESILEIGCAEGFILSLFKSKGKRVKGVDPSDKYAQIGRDNGVPIHTGFFDKNFTSETFDLIITCNTFEHIYYPLEVLQEIRKRTVRYLFLECPNVFMPRDNLKYNYFNTTHVYMYSPNTMRNILGLAGFETIRMDNSGFGIRVLAKKSEPRERMRLKDNYWELKKKIITHRIKWSLTAEWKDWLRKNLS